MLSIGMFVILIKIASPSSAPRTGGEAKKKKGGKKQADKKIRKMEMRAKLSCTLPHGLLTFD